MVKFKSNSATNRSNRIVNARRFFRPSGERLEDRLALAGVTVITHGALPSLFGLLPFPKWPIAMGEAILDRADGSATTHSTGSIYVHDQTSGLWKIPADTGIASTWTNSHSADEEIVLIYVWQLESLSPVNGMAEAAADNLFASLFQANTQLGGAIKNQRFIDLADRGNGELDLHFIGHSRGAVVNTLVAERFANQFPTWKIDQVTSLDAHPAKNPFQSNSTDPYYNATESSIRLPTFENVIFADAYYRTATDYQSLTTLDFSGVPVDGAHNFDLTPLLEANPGNDRDDPTKSLDSNGLSLEHSDVHLWYQSTIQDVGTVSDGEISNFDPNAAGWFPTTGRSSTGYAFSRLGMSAQRPAPLTSKSAASPLRTTIFNGDFLFGADTGNTIPGWQYHGGNHDADLSSGAVNLGNTFFADREFIRHNTFYIPASSDTLAFDYQVSDASSDDRFEVRIGDELVDVPPIAATGTFHREVVIPNRFRNAANTLEFRIRPIAGFDSKFSLDNVSLSTAANVDFRVTTFDVEVEPLASGQTVSTSFEIENSGNRASGVKVQWYLSRDANITTDDRPISSEEFVVLAAGASSGRKTKTLTLPQARDPIWTGDSTYFVGLIADPEHEITEASEANNANQGDGIDTDAVSVSGATGPVVIVTCGRGFVFSDLNGDDRFSSALDDGIPQAVVRLLSAADRSVVATTEAADNGLYQFPNATPGSYIISVDRPAAFGDQSSLELAVNIVTDPSCVDANVDLGRLQPNILSPRLFLASNRIGTSSRIELLKQLLDEAEADITPLHVNSESPTAMNSNSTEWIAETVPATSETGVGVPQPIVVEEVVAQSTELAAVSTDTSSHATVGIETSVVESQPVFGPAESNQVVTVAGAKADGESASDLYFDDEFGTSVVGVIDASVVQESFTTELPVEQQRLESESGSTILVYGPEPSSTTGESIYDQHAGLFAQIESLLDDCLRVPLPPAV
jgi:hypothetical protein